MIVFSCIQEFLSFWEFKFVYFDLWDRILSLTAEMGFFVLEVVFCAFEVVFCGLIWEGNGYRSLRGHCPKTELIEKPQFVTKSFRCLRTRLDTLIKHVPRWELLCHMQRRIHNMWQMTCGTISEDQY